MRNDKRFKTIEVRLALVQTTMMFIIIDLPLQQRIITATASIDVVYNKKQLVSNNAPTAFTFSITIIFDLNPTMSRRIIFIIGHRLPLHLLCGTFAGRTMNFFGITPSSRGVLAFPQLKGTTGSMAFCLSRALVGDLDGHASGFPTRNFVGKS